MAVDTPLLATPRFLEVFVIITDGNVLCLLELLFVLRDECIVDLNFWRFCELPDKLQIGLVRETTSKPQKRLFEIVIAPGAKIVILEVSFSMELDILGLHL